MPIPDRIFEIEQIDIDILTLVYGISHNWHGHIYDEASR